MACLDHRNNDVVKIKLKLLAQGKRLASHSVQRKRERKSNWPWGSLNHSPSTAKLHIQCRTPVSSQDMLWTKCSVVSSILSSLLGSLLFHQHWLQFPAYQPRKEADVAVGFINSLWEIFSHLADNKVWSCKSQNSKLWRHLHQISGLPRWLSGKESACNARDTGDEVWVPGSGRSSLGGNHNPLQYSCLENLMDRGAWWTTGLQRVGYNWVHTTGFLLVLWVLL